MNTYGLKEVHAIFLKSSGICIDTRKIEPNCLFLAIKGERYDGNKFAQDALKAGASYAIVNDLSLQGEGFIHVGDTLNFLQELSTYHRDYLDIPILSITGSNGKTTTKELCAHVLAAKYHLKCTKGNLNNHIGVPLTLLSLDTSLDLAIVEMGANHVGEIAALSEIAKPNVGLITNIGKAHIGEFGGAENIKKAKLELFQYIRKTKGVMLYNEDYDYFEGIRTYKKSVKYSDHFLNQETIQVRKSDPFIDMKIGNGAYFKVYLGGDHNVENVKAAIACGFYFGLDPQMIKQQLETFKATNNRSQWIEAKNNRVFLDAYNANPTSVEVAINYFDKLEEVKKLIILGDMFELGEHSISEHLAIYQRLIKHESEFYLIGENYARIASDDPRVFSSKKEFELFFKTKELKGYAILVKASRSLKLESLLELF